MIASLRSKVVGIPLGSTSAGRAIAKLVTEEGGGVLIGAPTTRQIGSLGGQLPYESSYCLQVDLDRAKSVDEFIQIGIGQFGHIDVLVVELPISSGKPSTEQRAMGVAVQRLLHCLDAVLRYSDRDLHFIVIAPPVGHFAIPVASAFLGARLATAESGKAQISDPPTLRMSLISPCENFGEGEDALARTAIHLMREPRTPDVTEYVVRRNARRCDRISKGQATRSKILVPK